ncbi:VanZ family protein [Paenibacillus xylanilyticus]|uniref:VanZ family protein n=1 Tax=Paenibacillus xylanilyticus TaxID=248903 RepID=A0A7Y6C1Y7_9BACL|nr:VanZ family protein [Paenibacillus xylanilyticus]NUU79065.1 VanZ family protein [Paenibacillus xylanilyticus]
MDFSQVIHKLLPIAGVALAVGLIVLGMVYLAYKVYRKMGGKRIITIWQFIASFSILGWLIIVMMLTTFSRGAHFDGWVNLELFSGYVSAWNQWSLSEFQLIIFNMLMFAPLGFLLPLLGMKTRRFKFVLIISLLVTLGIEAFQMVTGRGIFELDDLLHNTLGSLAGYGLMRAILDILKQKKISFKAIFSAVCIPLAFALLFTGAFIIYSSKELGNLSVRPATSQKMNQVSVMLDTKLPDYGEPAALYRSHEIHNMEYGKQMASLMKDHFQLQQRGRISIDGFNRVWSLYDSTGKEYTFNYNVNSGNWWLARGQRSSSSMETEILTEKGEAYDKWLSQHGLLPKNAEFSTQNEDTVRWDLHMTNTDMIIGQQDFDNGMIIIVPAAESLIPQELFYSMNKNAYIRTVDVESPAKAYEEILKGNFSIYNDLKAGDELIVKGYELTYTYDSKGYYQPVYQFEGTVNGAEWSTLIPAMKN